MATFCERQKIALRVLYKNAVIFKNDVVGANHGHNSHPVIVYHICGDHAYFYEDQHVKHGAARLPQRPEKIMLKSEALVKLRTRVDDDDQTPFSEMVEYKLDAFLEQIETGLSKTFYCFQREIRDVKKELECANVNL